MVDEVRLARLLELWGPAEDSAAAVRLLAQHGVVDAELAQRLAAATGFRNVLVHGYAEIDDERVVANLDLLGDFDAFSDQVRRWVASRPAPDRSSGRNGAEPPT